MTPRPAPRDAPEAARFFLALADATRLALLDELRSGDRTVGALVEALGCPQPKVSRHLKVLKDAGLVADRKDGRNVSYGLTPPSAWAREAREWLGRLEAARGKGTKPVSRPAKRRGAAPEPASPAPAGIERDGPPTTRPDLEDFLL